MFITVGNVYYHIISKSFISLKNDVITNSKTNAPRMVSASWTRAQRFFLMFVESHYRR